MSTSSPPPLTSTDGARDAVLWQWPRLAADDRLVGGVAAAIGREIGLDSRLVRAAWVLLLLVGGWGAVLYLICWGTLAFMDYNGKTRQGPAPIKAKDTRQRWIGFGLIVAGLVGLEAGMPRLSFASVLALGLAGGALVVAWQQLNPAASSAGRRNLVWAMLALLVAGIGATAFVLTVFGWGDGGLLVALFVAVFFAGVAMTAPWWWNFLRALDDERQARVRSDERAAMAAHLHDSVLQTLALIQKNADDPEAMVVLARRQERELRSWLDPTKASRSETSLQAQIESLVSDVEDLYRVTIDAIVVGDESLDADIEMLLGAIREACVNAAKHSGCDHFDVYVEVSAERIEAFVRDRGVGFDLAAVDADRRGISHSIQQRMQRIGGAATVFAQPGEGTEIELMLPRRQETM